MTSLDSIFLILAREQIISIEKEPRFAALSQTASDKSQLTLVERMRMLNEHVGNGLVRA